MVIIVGFHICKRKVEKANREVVICGLPEYKTSLVLSVGNRNINKLPHREV